MFLSNSYEKGENEAQAVNTKGGSESFNNWTWASRMATAQNSAM